MDSGDRSLRASLRIADICSLLSGSRRRVGRLLIGSPVDFSAWRTQPCDLPKCPATTAMDAPARYISIIGTQDSRRSASHLAKPTRRLCTA
jgi:hypothetical protein